jgi:hypothetical protein
MIRSDERQGESSGLDPAKIDRDKPEAGASYGGQHFRAERIRNRPHQICGRQLDSCDIVVVANSQIAESQLPQRGLGALDLAQLGWCDRMVVGNTGGEARRSGLVGYLQAKCAREHPHCRLGDAGVGERPQDIVVGGGTRTWSIRSPSIVGVLPVRDGIQPVTVGDPVIDPAEEFLLAEKTTISPVRPILRTVTFVGPHLDEPYADLACDFVCPAPLLGREAGGYAEQSDDPLRTKGAHCERQ